MKEDSKKVILIGDYAIRANRGNENAIKVKGCPPKIADSMMAMINNTLNKKRAKKILSIRLIKGYPIKLAFTMSIFPENLLTS